MTRKIKLFSAAGPKKASTLSNSMNVDGRAGYPYKLFSPFTYSQDFRIPVPGQEDMYSCCVENVWQGLKIIQGSPDFSIFTNSPVKRKGNVQGHLYDRDILDYVEARKKVFQPTYFHYLENYVDDELKEEVLKRGLKERVVFHDIMKNVDINNPETPLAHAYFVAMYFNEYSDRRLEDVKEELDKRFFENRSRHETLADPLARSLDYYGESSETEKLLIEFSLHSEHEETDEYKERYYSKLLKKIEEL
jgi:hypothetical protein